MTLTRGTPPCTPHMEVPPPGCKDSEITFITLFREDKMQCANSLISTKCNLLNEHINPNSLSHRSLVFRYHSFRYDGRYDQSPQVRSARILNSDLQQKYFTNALNVQGIN